MVVLTKKTTQQLRSLAILLEDLSLSLSTHGDSQWSVTPVSGDMTPLLTSMMHRHTHKPNNEVCKIIVNKPLRKKDVG